MVSTEEHDDAKKGRGSRDFELDKKERNEIQEAFNLFDIQRKGRISAKDITVALRALGTEPEKEEIRSIFTVINKDAGDLLDLEEFTKIMKLKLNQAMSQSETKRAFSLLEDDTSTTISFENLRKIAADVGEELEDEELIQMMLGAGATSPDDTINLEQ
ncbi:hypothetical protein AAMO2058_000705600 [Amorphochlora amoebiformis]